MSTAPWLPTPCEWCGRVDELSPDLKPVPAFVHSPGLFRHLLGDRHYSEGECPTCMYKKKSERP